MNKALENFHFLGIKNKTSNTDRKEEKKREREREIEKGRNDI